jgi:hypothetical protein
VKSRDGLRRRRPILRLFISSTFSDFKHERDDLQEHLFPRLERLCASRQFEFQAIDLRWGVSTEAGLDHRTMKLCFEELRRAQEVSPLPNFLVLLGNRYGWRPLPEEISDEEFRRLEEAAASASELHTIRTWYRPDKNSLKPVFLLRSRRPDHTTPDVWNPIQRELWSVINRAYSPGLMKGRFLHSSALDRGLPAIVRFQASATEQEIWQGALKVPDADRHVVAIFREIEPSPGGQTGDGAEEYIDLDDRRDESSTDPRQALADLKGALRNRLGAGQIIETSPVRLEVDPRTSRLVISRAHLAEMREKIYAKLEPVILLQMEEFWGPGEMRERTERELEREIEEHRRFGRERAPHESFTGRDQSLQRIRSYLRAGEAKPLVISGSSGSGKTALVARAAEETPPDALALVRFIGISPASSDIRALLDSLCRELRLEHPLSAPLPQGGQDLARELADQLAAVAIRKPVFLFLDALDQLDGMDDGRSLFWLPDGALPSSVRVIVSCLSDRPAEDPVGEPLIELKSRGYGEGCFIDLDGDVLSEDEAATLFFRRWLPAAGRGLTEEQTRWIRSRMTVPSGRQLLYLKMLFEEARRWTSDSQPPPSGRNAAELLEVLFSRLEESTNHGATVEYALGYVASARRGLAETEILEALYRDEDYRTCLRGVTVHQLPEFPRRIPIAMWSRLRLDLDPYLSERSAPGGTVLTFFHRAVEEYVRQRWLADPAARARKNEGLARYFHEKGDPQADRSWRPAQVRAFDELPFQRMAANAPADLAALMGDLSFAAAKSAAGLVFDLLEDYRLTLERLPFGHPAGQALRQIRFILGQYAAGLHRHPECSLQQLLLGIASMESPDRELQGQGLALTRARREKGDLQAWAFVPEHRIRSVLQVPVTDGRSVENFALTRRGLLLRCAGGEWMELSDDLKCLARGDMTASLGTAMAMSDRTLLLSSANALLVWKRWPANDPDFLSFAAPITVLACSANGDFAAVGCRDGFCSLHETSGLSGEAPAQHRFGSPAVAVWFDSAARAVFVTRGGSLHRLSGESGMATSFAAIGEECLLACSAGEEAVCIVSKDHRLRVRTFAGALLWDRSLEARPCGLASAPADEAAEAEIMVGLEDGRLQIFDAGTGRAKRTLAISNKALRQIETAAGRSAVVCRDSANNLFSVLRADGGVAAFKALPAGRNVLTMRWDEASASLQTISREGQWTIVRKERLPEGEGWSFVEKPPLDGPLDDARFLPDGSLVALHRESHESRIWRHTQAAAGSLRSHCLWSPDEIFVFGPCFVNVMEMSPDGTFYALASNGREGRKFFGQGRLNGSKLRPDWKTPQQDIHEINLSEQGEVMIITQSRGTPVPLLPARVLHCRGRVHTLLEEVWRSGLRNMERGAGRGLFGTVLSGDGRWAAAVDANESLWMFRFDPDVPDVPPQASRLMEGVSACMLSETGLFCAALQSDWTIRLLARDAAGGHHPAAQILLPEQPQSIILMEQTRRIAVSGMSYMLAMSF